MEKAGCLGVIEYSNLFGRKNGKTILLSGIGTFFVKAVFSFLKWNNRITKIF